MSPIGGVFSFAKFTIDDPHVCERGIDTLLKALADVRARGVVGHPQITALSTTGISRAGRDMPLVMYGFYRAILGVPHVDKEILEEKLIGSGEVFVIVRPSLLVEGDDASSEVRVGVEDVSGGKHVFVKKERGYTISKAAIRRWIYQNLLNKDAGDKYSGKAIGLTR